MPKSFVDPHPFPAYNFYPEDPPEADPVPLGSFILDVPIMVLGLIRNIKRELMSGVDSVLFFPTES